MIIFGARMAARANFFRPILVSASLFRPILISASLFRPDIKAHKPILNWRYYSNRQPYNHLNVKLLHNAIALEHVINFKRKPPLRSLTSGYPEQATEKFA
jgi:hypothetical protein